MIFFLKKNSYLPTEICIFCFSICNVPTYPARYFNLPEDIVYVRQQFFGLEATNTDRYTFGLSPVGQKSIRVEELNPLKAFVKVQVRAGSLLGNYVLPIGSTIYSLGFNRLYISLCLSVGLNMALTCVLFAASNFPSSLYSVWFGFYPGLTFAVSCLGVSFFISRTM